jgi:hypothetical protein
MDAPSAGGELESRCPTEKAEDEDTVDPLPEALVLLGPSIQTTGVMNVEIAVIMPGTARGSDDALVAGNGSDRARAASRPSPFHDKNPGAMFYRLTLSLPTVSALVPVDCSVV